MLRGTCSQFVSEIIFQPKKLTDSRQCRERTVRFCDKTLRAEMTLEQLRYSRIGRSRYLTCEGIDDSIRAKREE